MKTTIDHLITPRFEVIADFPKSIYSVGEIITIGTRNNNMLIYCDPDGPKYTDYPHLFMKLNWWEYRNENEMPKYVKIGRGEKLPHTEFDYYEIIRWDMNDLIGVIDDAYVASITTWTPEYTYQPCSEEEYLKNK